MELIGIPSGNVFVGTSDEVIHKLVNQTGWASEWHSRGFFSREQPQHACFVYHFQISKYPVTVGEYRKFIEEGGYWQKDHWTQDGWQWLSANQIEQPAYWDEEVWIYDDRLPVVGVSWFEAVAYCHWLSAKLSKKIALPTEIQWERAARGGDTRLYPWGDVFDPGKCNTRSGKHQKTRIVGYYSPAGDSPFGCCDMVGNVSEWTLSKFCPYPYSMEDKRENTAGSEERVTRGGSWHSPDPRARVNARGMNDPFFRDYDLGFRIVMNDA